MPAQALTYSLGAAAPAGAVIDSVTGEFSWTPREPDGPGVYTFPVTVTDTQGASDSQDVTILVSEVNEAPFLASVGELFVNEHETAAFTATATDADLPAQTLFYHLGPNAPAAATLDPVSGEFQWDTEETDGPGKYMFEVRVTDERGMTDSIIVTIHVAEVNEAPVLDPVAPLVVNEYETAAFTATATDGDVPVQTLTYSLGPGAPAGAAIDPDSGAFTWTTGETDGPGVFTVQVIATDEAGAFDTMDVTIDVLEVNVAPVLDAIADLSVNEHETAAFTASASDTDLPVQSLEYSLTGAVPAGATIDPTTGAFTWTPGEADGPGVFTFQVVVTDSYGAGDSQDVTITVLEVNEAPILDAIDDLTVNEHQTAAFTATASDVDIPVQALTYSLGANAPAGAAIDPDSGEFTWTPGEADGPGVYTFEVRVTDDGGLFDVTDVTVTVSEVNEHPVLDAVPDLYVTNTKRPRLPSRRPTATCRLKTCPSSSAVPRAVPFSIRIRVNSRGRPARPTEAASLRWISLSSTEPADGTRPR